MSFDYRFRMVESPKERDILYKFLLSQELNVPYPNFGDWACKAIDETKIGWKKSILVFSYGFPIACSVSQQHKEFGGIEEWKNLRVIPRERREGIASFLEGKISKMAREEKRDAILCDTRENPELESFLRSRDYNLIQKISLYDCNMEDRIYIKVLNSTTNIFKPLKNKIISSAA